MATTKAIELVFNTQGNEKQKDVCRAWLDNEVTDIVYGGSKGSGKSFLGCSLIFGDAFMYPDTHYFIARSTLSDLRKFTIPSVYEVFGIWGIKDTMYKYNGQDNCFVLYNGSKVFLLGADYMPSDPMYMRFGSMQMTRGWIEEAGEFHRDAKNNLQASIGRWKNGVYNLVGKLLQTCNPASNYLKSDYYYPFKSGKLESWKRFIQAFPQDNKMLPAGYLDNLKRILTKNQKERLLFGNWEYDDDPSVLCDYDAICDVFTNEHVKTTGNRYISADIAMQGRDKFIAGVWDGFVCDVAVSEDKSTAKGITATITKLMDRYSIGHSRLIADADGVGAFVGSYIDGCKEFHGGGSATNKEEYANIKSECAYKLAEKINKREIYIKCSEEQRTLIIEELGVLKADDVDADERKKRIIKKDYMKELIGRSPDYLDMLIMRMWFESKDREFFDISSCDY
jgi:hypothetical protein